MTVRRNWINPEEVLMMHLPTLFKACAVTAVVVIMLGCSFLENAVPQAGESPAATSLVPATPSPSPNEGPSDEMEEVTDPRVEGTLALRSVQMELQADIPGADANRTLIFVDAVGNVRMETALPIYEDSMVTPDSPDWNVFEIFIVDGLGYVRSGKTGNAEANLLQNTALSDILYFPTGPGMWLILLPEESFTSAGKESKGGFDAVKYTVDGLLELGQILGEFWVDESTGALVGANLSLAKSFFYPFEESTGEVVTITFLVEKADVAPITVP
jgi:hypothetical protein